ncbi:hypothetical protein [Nannocystis punicea]|uniref:Uncharacterized protein n=1 Tax=Nannocystis punicea TaxID=2995304 RepID=A0ABY7HEE3_9BACT|nr:hypothetical protein [Nannocystis poenicansa]WAS97399.1 hypothetical protein O0S08_14725 [Nannocystis poenicansa]
MSPRQVELQRTRLFARHVGGRQLLVYAMRLHAEERSAMILPIPLVPGSLEDGVVFRDLSTVPALFDELMRGFPEPQPRPAVLFTLSAERLQVHRVGSFEASFVPTRADFVRLDPRFRLSDSLWHKLPQYADWGFVVFQFQPGAQDVHPMAFEFPSRYPEWLYFPTVHVHDGRLYSTAQFDHRLYFQGLARVTYRDTVFGDGLPPVSGGANGGGCTGETSGVSAKRFVSPAAIASGAVAADRPVHRLSMFGRFPNEDTWLRPPAD